jgi:hypothetical protein
MLFFSGPIMAGQQPDTVYQAKPDTLLVKDSLTLDTLAALNIKPGTGTVDRQSDSLISAMLRFDADEFYGRENEGEEGVFYLMVFLLLFFAMLNRLFPKYFSDLYRLFFRTTLNQSQVREQMIQSPLPSLLLNIFFVINGGLYLAYLFRHNQVHLSNDFRMMFLYCAAAVSGIYLVKFAGLKFTGWIFNVADITDSYIFIVFLVNKIIGIFLLPVLILLAFTDETIYTVTLTLSYFVIGALLMYRYILSFQVVRNQISVSPFHFLLYLIAFEIAPLLIIYKSLLLILERTA